MMNEFPGKYQEAVRELGEGNGEVQLLNGGEYLTHLWSLGIKPTNLPTGQPLHTAAFFKKYYGDAA
jgi:hypothetical protein